jgi:hypothetical protein
VANVVKIVDLRIVNNTHFKICHFCGSREHKVFGIEILHACPIHPCLDQYLFRFLFKHDNSVSEISIFFALKVEICKYKKCKGDIIATTSHWFSSQKLANFIADIKGSAQKLASDLLRNLQVP